MTAFLYNTLRTRWPEILGLLLTVTSGFLVPWISQKSGNSKKLNKKMVLNCLLHLVYLTVVPLAISVVAIVAAEVINEIAEVAGTSTGVTVIAVTYAFSATISILVFIGVMRISKRMRILMAKAKEISRWLYIMLQWAAVLSIALSYVMLAFVGSVYEDAVTSVAMVISWAFQIWWLCLMAVIVWKASEYVYSKIKITMIDGEILYFDCSPKVCRVYRSYIRILKRDENDVVVQEMQINEIAIKHIEYSK